MWSMQNSYHEKMNQYEHEKNEKQNHLTTTKSFFKEIFSKEVDSNSLEIKTILFFKESFSFKIKSSLEDKTSFFFKQYQNLFIL